MSSLRKRLVPAVALIALLLAAGAFATVDEKGGTQTKDIWDRANIVGKLLISFVAAAVPSLIAWQIHNYNKRQTADEVARRKREQEVEQERENRDLKIRRLEMVHLFMPQLTSAKTHEQWSAIALINTLGDLDFVKEISAAFMRPLVAGEDRRTIEQLATNPNQAIASVASEAYINVLSSARQQQPRVNAAPVGPLYYDELSTDMTVSKHINYADDSAEHYGEFVVTRGLHAIEIPAKFRVGIYLVSNEFFKMFVDAGGYEDSEYWQDAGNRRSYRTRDETPGPAAWLSRTAFTPGLERHPVSGISYFEAVAFVRWLQRMRPPQEPRWRWTLPTEDMWEFSARSSDGRQYPWGSKWLPDRCNSLEASVNTTSEVSQYPDGRSEVGCFDMAGNVWEFVDAQDEYPGTCTMRGGSFRNNSVEVRSHLRLVHVPKNHRPPDFGFRVAQVADLS